MKAILQAVFAAVAICVYSGCDNQGQPTTTGTPHTMSTKPSDYYRLELETPGGPLPFIIARAKTRSSSGFVIEADVVNGPERIPVLLISNERAPDIGRYQSVVTGTLDDPDWTFGGFDASLVFDQHKNSGVYSKFRGEGTAEIPFTITTVSGPEDRFDREHPADPEAIKAIDGRWRVKFDSSDDHALGVFNVTEDGLATGTFLTNTGDYRYLEGLVDGRTLKHSCFDGGHAFLFHAMLQDDGSLKGDFWSGDWWHEEWTATPAPDDFALSDGFDLTEWTGDAGLDDLFFVDLNGDKTSVADVIEANGGGPAIIEVFGSWCPNCHDAAEAVKALKEKYDITVVGLAFELTEEHERSVRQVRTFMQKHEADWPVLIAGTADKADASAKLPVFDKLRAYPTTVFVRADGSIASVHTGFTGAAAPKEHRALMEKWDAIVRGMMEEE